MIHDRQELEALLDRPVAIFGAGVTGHAVARFFHQRGVDTVFYDERPHLTGESVSDFLGAASGLHGLAVVSPGFAADHPWLQAAKELGVVCLGDLDLGWLYWPGRVIAVTGTNGKSTTTVLLERAMRCAGMDAVGCGNIGEPLLKFVQEATSETWAVVEVSSFQAEIMQLFVADAVIWTNFDEDHLNRHRGMKAYFAAKARLLDRRRGDGAPGFVGVTVEEAYRLHRGGLPPVTEVVPVEDSRLADLRSGTLFSAAPQCENFCLARALWDAFQFHPKAIVEAANTMKALPHRLEWVGSARGVQFWNDSKATNFSAALAALRRFDQPVYWIGGGRDKGGDLQRFARNLDPHVGRAFLVGEVAGELAAHCRESGIPVELCDSLENAVHAAFRRARSPGDIVFSPGFSSHDAWISFAERGNAFRAHALRLIESTTAPTPT